MHFFVRLFAVLVIVGGPFAGFAAQRDAWTTSRVEGTPDPALPFRTERAFPQLSFSQITVLAVAPGLDRMFVGEQGGKVWSFPLANDTATKQLALDLKTAVACPAETRVEALYGMAFDPQFATNRHVYVCYVLRGPDQAVLHEGTRVSRFRMASLDPPTIDPTSEAVLLTYRAGGHNGGCLEFGPDGMLYLSTGDAMSPNPPDELNTGQDCADVLASILRIDVHTTDGKQPYAIPADNPFVGQPGLRGEVWAYGLRNPWKMTFDRENGDLWVADVGRDQWESVHWVTKSANFGWGAYEGRQPVRNDVTLGPTPVIPPLVELPHTISASVTGGYVYRGQRFPELRGEYVFGDWETKRVWAARRDAHGQGTYRDLADSGLQIVAFGQDHAGELYLADYGQGVLHTLVRNKSAGQPSEFPRRLSETGLFAHVAQQQPAAGVIPFEINQPQWSDYATAERWIAIPGTAPVVCHPADVPIPGSMFSRQHEFPAGTVLAKTLSLALQHKDPNSVHRIETQVLHYDGRDWRGYSYRWNEQQTDAELVPAEGAEQTLTIQDARWPGGQREQRWSFAGRLQCLSCHTPWAQHALAFTPLQLNRLSTIDGHPKNQWQHFEEIGLLSRVTASRARQSPLTPVELSQLPALARHDDAHATAEQHLRSYWHVNCSHCHRFNGGGAGSFELLFKNSTRDLQLIDEPARQGTFDVAHARLIAPGDPASSVLYLRMAKFGRGRMPHLGSVLVDEQALAWLQTWIHGLAESPAPTSTSPLGRALATARLVGNGTLSPTERDAILTAAHTDSNLLVQDLFAGFQPAVRQRKTLGTAIRPEHVLSHTGLADRGEQLFWRTSGVNCKQCHRVGAQGGNIGPELGEVARRRTSREMLESLIDPSKVIDPKYATMVVQTTAGRSTSGLLVRHDERELVLRDSQGRETTVPRSEIDEIVQSPKSLMPEQLLRDLTAQEAADLVAYLASLRELSRD